ncbi:nitronate monooxygenase [Microbacterium elymi]|uniref:nitronate monooxygenase n=1 Tax=Microbacterium elymi TaxID=2909587 RepID=UPI00338DA945
MNLSAALGIEHPIVLGPFGGLSSVALVAAVSDAGGLGSYGLYGYAPDRIRDTIAQLRAATRQAVRGEPLAADRRRGDARRGRSVGRGRRRRADLRRARRAGPAAARNGSSRRWTSSWMPCSRPRRPCSAWSTACRRPSWWRARTRAASGSPGP